MKRSILYIWTIRLVCVLTLTASVSRGEDVYENAPMFLNVQFENDLFAGGGDRFYTHGTEMTCLMPGKVPEQVRELAELFPFYKCSDREAVKFSLGQLIFTPEDTHDPELIKKDRPYAGFMFGTLGIASQFFVGSNVAWGNILEVTVGVVGPSAKASETQTWIHEETGSGIPQGWDNQLKNELGIGLSYTRMWGYLQPVTENTQAVISAHMTGMVGNVYTYGSSGAMFRWGKNAHNAVSPPSIRPAFPGIPAFGNACRHSWYLFAGFESRLMLRNIFLDGNTFEDSHSVSKELLVADLMYGFAFQYCGFRLAVTTMRRSREFVGQPDSTRYGAITMTWKV